MSVVWALVIAAVVALAALDRRERRDLRERQLRVLREWRVEQRMTPTERKGRLNEIVAKIDKGKPQ